MLAFLELVNLVLMVLLGKQVFLENLVFQVNQGWQGYLGKEDNQDSQAYQELANQEKTASRVNLGTLVVKEKWDLLACQAPRGCLDMVSQDFQDLTVKRGMQDFPDNQD